MNYKMVTNTYLFIESKKQTNQRKRTEFELWMWRAFGWLPDGRGAREMGEEVRGLSSTNR